MGGLQMHPQRSEVPGTVAILLLPLYSVYLVGVRCVFAMRAPAKVRQQIPHVRQLQIPAIKQAVGFYARVTCILPAPIQVR